MSEYIEIADSMTLPVVPLHEIVAFPGVPLSFNIANPTAKGAIEYALSTNSLVFLVGADEDPGESTALADASHLRRIGTVAKIRQAVKTGSAPLQVIALGNTRAMANSYRLTNDVFFADLTVQKTIVQDSASNVVVQAYMRQVLNAMSRILRHVPADIADSLLAARSIKDPGALADFVAATLLIRSEDKQAVLECLDPQRRLDLLLTMLTQEMQIREASERIQHVVRERLARGQKEYYLREQLRAIEEELGEGGNDADEYERRILSLHLPQASEKKLLKENAHLAKLPFGSSEASVLTSYLDTVLDLPWNKSSHDRVNVEAAKKVLNDDHNGLDKVKERILEFLAVRQMNPAIGNQIICLVGPPGVGKTSIAASIARAMKRKYVRVSLGGVRDEADIRGHRKTYIGSMPGRIMEAIGRAGVNNPLILLDEVDKMTADSHGDPTSALLEVLDGEQNKTFRDHYVELPFDLSNCFFIATANTLETVPRPLIDRMEIIELAIYTKREKLAIAKDHLIPKQRKRHGLTARQVKITDQAITEVIDCYTREAGVRNLERRLADLLRKAARKLLSGEKQLKIDVGDIKAYLGERKLLPQTLDTDDEIGLVNGLAYTELGGDVLQVEAAVMDGTGKLELTGSLGDVMKESAHAAYTYVRTVAADYGIDPKFYQNKDIHIHVPEGAVPKDGPSAGVTLTTALVSALGHIPVRHDIAMTGEVTLRGRVLPIGGLKEKTMAAYTAGARTVLIPEDNMRDLSEIDPLARENLQFVACRNVKDVLDRALLRKD